MVFNEIVQKVGKRLNLTSEDAITRIGEEVNARYRRATSSIGLNTSRRVDTTLTLDPSDVLSTLPLITLSDVSKVVRVQFLSDGSRPKTLRELTYDSLTNLIVVRRNPQAYAIKRMGPKEVILILDGYPTNIFSLQIEGYDLLNNLEENDEPYFPEDYHDLLFFGACADELRKMEKYPLAQDMEAQYERLISDLRMFIAKSAYMDIYQGKDKPSQVWYRPWASRIGIE